MILGPRGKPSPPSIRPVGLAHVWVSSAASPLSGMPGVAMVLLLLQAGDRLKSASEAEEPFGMTRVSLTKLSLL